MKALLALSLVTASFVVPTAFGRATVACSSPGDWPHTKDAAWLARALTRAGLGSFGCTGSAFVADLGGELATGQIYIWTTRGPRTSEQMRASTRVAGVVVRYDELRGFWRARGRTVWVETASSRPLLPIHRWARIVRATLVTRR